MTDRDTREDSEIMTSDLLDRLTEFLSVGGFINPGMTASVNEDALRTLLLDLQVHLRAASDSQTSRLKERTQG